MIFNYKDLRELNGLIFLQCGKYLADYFIYESHISIYSFEKDDYIFLYTQELKDAVAKMDILHSTALFFEGYWDKIKDKPLK